MEERLGLLASKSHFDKEAELVRQGFEGPVGLLQMRWIRRIVRRLHIARGMLVLDVGCGTAFHLSEFSRLGTRSVGCDFSKGMLQQAKSVTTQAGDRLELLLADSRYLPFKGQAFDIVFSNAVLHHVPGERFRRESVVEMVRVLRDGGGILISVANASNLVYWLVRRMSRRIFREDIQGGKSHREARAWFHSRRYGWVYIGKIFSTDLRLWLRGAGVQVLWQRYAGPNLPPVGARFRTRFPKVLDLFYYTLYDMMDVLPRIDLLRVCSTDFYVVGQKVAK